MIPSRRRNEILETLKSEGGSENAFSDSFQSFESQHTKRLPTSFNLIIQYMFEIYYKIRDMVEKDIPRAFPNTDPKVKTSGKYAHDDAEMFFARPVTIIEDANMALEVCAQLKEYVNISKSLFTSYFPKQIDNMSFRTEIRDNFQGNNELFNSFLENIEKIQNMLLRSKMSSLSMTIDMNELDKLKNQLIKIGYDTIGGHNDLVEVFPNVLTMRETTPGTLPAPEQRRVSNSFIANDSIKDLVCQISDRFLEEIRDDEK